jgi:hypothetical protein
MTKEQKSENMKAIKFNQKLKDERLIPLIAEIYDIQNSLYRCMADETELHEIQTLYPARDYRYNPVYKNLSFSRSLTEIRELYGEFGISLWKCFFTYIQKGGYSKETMQGYSSYWSISQQRAKEFSSEVNSALIGLNQINPTFEIKVRVIIAMVQYSRVFTQYHFALSHNKRSVLVEGVKHSKQIIDPIEKGFYLAEKQMRIDFLAAHSDLVQESIKSKNLNALEHEFQSNKGSINHTEEVKLPML